MAQQIQVVRSFRQETQPNIVPLGGNVQFTNFNQPQQNLQVGRSGWLHKIFLYWTGTLATGAGTPGGAFNTYPPLPYSLIKRIRVYTNTNNEIVNMTGWGLFLQNLYSMSDAQPQIDQDTYLNTTNRAAIYAATSGNVAASTAYTQAGWLEIPITTDDALFLGALFLQSDQVTLNVEITFAGLADVASAVTGVPVTPNFTFTGTAWFFDDPPQIPNTPKPTPNMNYLHYLREENRGITGTGEQVYRLPLGNTYVRVMGMSENNGAPIANNGYLNVGLRFAQVITPFNEPYNLHIARNKFYLHKTLLDGLTNWDRSWGSGVPGLWEGRDFINSSQTADLELFLQYSSALSLVNPNLRLITEQLAPLGGIAGS